MSLAVLGAAAGLALVVATAVGTEPALAEQTEARAGSLSLWVESSQWVGGAHDDASTAGGDDQQGHDHGEGEGDQAEEDDHAEDEQGEPGHHDDEEAEQENVAAGAGPESFQMPSAMMPGTPDEGFQRMQIDLTFLNKGSTAADVGPQDFYLQGADGQTWETMLGGTFATTSLRTGQALNTIVAYDIPETDAEQEIELVWRSSEETKRFAIATSGASHG